MTFLALLLCLSLFCGCLVLLNALAPQADLDSLAEGNFKRDRSMA